MVQLLAFELVAPDGAEPHMAKMIDLTMLGMLNGRECTQVEYRLLLERAGFTFDAVTATPDVDLDRQGPGLTPGRLAPGQCSRLAKTLMATARMTAPNR
jgi:hypothetical protein